MKNFLLFIFVGVFNLPVFAQIDTVSLSKLGLHGHVSQIMHVTFLAKDSLGLPIRGEVVDERGFKTDDPLFYKTNYVYLFNEKGHQTSFVQLYQNLTKQREVIYSYDGDLVSSSGEKWYMSDAHLRLQTYYTYGLVKELISSICYRNGSLWRKNVYKYDSNGNISESFKINSDGDILSHNLYKYNSGGLLLCEKSENNPDDNNMDYEYLYTYDSKGRKIESKAILRGWSIKNTFQYGLDTSYPLKTKYYRNDILTSWDDYRYVNGRLEKTIMFNASGVVKDVKRYQYSNDGSTTEIIDRENKETTRNQHGEIIRMMINKGSINMEEYVYEYTYDSHGNWTQAVESKNTIPIIIKTRTIKYY